MARLYSDRCFVCNIQTKNIHNFSIHHLWYIKDDAYYDDYKDIREYYKELLKHIREDPDRFVLLCRKHHWVIERLAKIKFDKFRRMYLVIKHMHLGRMKILKKEGDSLDDYMDMGTDGKEWAEL